MSSKKNGASYVTHMEFAEGMGEQVENIKDIMHAFNLLKQAVNTQAEVIGLHRFVLEKFVPLPHLEAASKEYYELRQREIATQNAQIAQA